MEQWILKSYQGLLPETCLHLVREHILRPDAPFHTVKGHIYALSRSIVSTMTPILAPLLDRLVRAIYDSPDIVVLGFFLILILLTIQVLSWISRAMMFWTRLVMRLVFWAHVAAVAAAVWQRGFTATARDVLEIGGWLLGCAATVRDIWVQEYHKYEAQTRPHGRPPLGSRY